VLFDVTEQRRREQASALLAAAGQVLAGDEPVEQRLDAVAPAHQMLPRGQPFPGAGRRLPPAPTIT
jgi:hypothetical protein